MYELHMPIIMLTQMQLQSGLLTREQVSKKIKSNIVLLLLLCTLDKTVENFQHYGNMFVITVTFYKGLNQCFAMFRTFRVPKSDTDQLQVETKKVNINDNAFAITISSSKPSLTEEYL